MSTRVFAVGRSRKLPLFSSFIRKSPVVLLLAAAAPAFAQQPAQVFTPGNLVILVSGCGQPNGTQSSCAIPNSANAGNLNSPAGTYGDNQASPVTLFQYAPNGVSNVSFVNATVMPQTPTGVNNLPLSAEYGSSSEGELHLSGDGHYLTFMEYGIPATTYNASPLSYGPVNALAQSTSVTTQSTYTPVPRVVALVDNYGTIKDNTAVYNVFDENNPRSVFTANESAAYISGQGNSPDHTGGVFYVPIGATTTNPTPITGNDTTSNTFTQDTRDVQIVNNQLYVSVDSKEGSGAARSYIGTLGTPNNPPTSAGSTGSNPPVMLNGFGNSGGTGKVAIGTGSGNNGNAFNAGQTINISPVGYFFAAPNVIYVADSGNGKQTSAQSGTAATGTGYVGDGGLQKWINSASDGSGTWSLAYTLYQGLNLVKNPTAVPANTSGTTGLYSVTGQVVGSSVLLYATNYTINDLDQTYLYGISDTLTNTTPPGASAVFTKLATAPVDSNFKGISFAPTPAASSVDLHVEDLQVAPNTTFIPIYVTGIHNGNWALPNGTISVKVGNGPTIPAGCGGYGYSQYCSVTWPVSLLSPGANTITVANAGDSTYQPTFSTGIINLLGTQNFANIIVNGFASNYGVASLQLSSTVSWSGAVPTTLGATYFTVNDAPPLPAACTVTGNSAVCTATYTTSSATAAGFNAVNFFMPGDGNYQQSVGSTTIFLQ